VDNKKMFRKTFLEHISTFILFACDEPV